MCKMYCKCYELYNKFKAMIIICDNNKQGNFFIGKKQQHNVCSLAGVTFDERV